VTEFFNPLNDDLNPIYHFLALLGAHPILHVSGVRVNEKLEEGRSSWHCIIIS
jgi:hypothetical protein